MGIGAIIAAIAAALGIATTLSTTSQRKGREEAQVSVLQEQYEAVAGREEDIEAFYGGLTEFAQQETELERQDVSRDFFGGALSLGRERKERIRSSGMVQTGTSDINLAEIIAGRDIKKSFADIEQSRQGDLLRIGKARELELQGIEDMLYELETGMIARGKGEKMDFMDYASEFVGGGGLFGVVGGLLGGLLKRD